MSTHPKKLFTRFSVEDRTRIMIEQLEKQIHLLQKGGYDTTPAVRWLNEILPYQRLLKYGKLTSSDLKDLQKIWEEFIILFFDEIMV